jgi:uncharacterized repeat protein (TIGR03803 family)
MLELNIFKLNPMKKLILISLAILHFSNVNSQSPQLWGTMQIGGPTVTGIIFHINGDGSSFGPAPGFGGGSPQGDLLPYNGYLYGLSVSGGSNSIGDLFKYNASTGSYTVLHHFDTISGYYPRASLFLASNGKMYGTANNGGTYNFGTFFSFDPTNNSFAKLVDFDITNGRYPLGNAIEYAGKLYATTTSGGAFGSGEIFSYDLTSGTFTVEHSFNFTDGFGPFGSLIVYNSLLYGMAFGGGTTGYGTIFSFNPQTSSLTTLHTFSQTDGSAPYTSNLLLAGNGLFYGMTSQGGANNLGVIFSFNPAGNIFTKLHDFTVLTGATPNGSLMQASDGKLYGTTYNGGNNNVGTIFSYDIGNSLYTKIYDCALVTASFPNAGLVEYNATGIQETNNETIKLLTNPVQDYLRFYLADFNQPLSVQILSTDGKLVMENTATTIGNGEYQIKTNGLSAGNYFLSISSGKNNSILKFVKQP